jgi:trehalose/maltose hydrolase-like predicted phosphorylase
MTIIKVEEGCHITSMAGTWMSIVEGLAECDKKRSIALSPRT